MMTSDINLFGGKTNPHHERVENIWSALFPLRREVTYFLWSSIVHNPLGPFRREYLNSKSQLRWEKLKCPFSDAAPNLQNRNQTDWSKAIELALTNYSIRGCYVRVCESLRNFHCQALAQSLVTFSPPNNQTCFSIIQNFRSCILSINHFVLICIAMHWRNVGL